jgi:hypothetical protein
MLVFLPTTPTEPAAREEAFVTEMENVFSALEETSHSVLWHPIRATTLLALPAKRVCLFHSTRALVEFVTAIMSATWEEIVSHRRIASVASLRVSIPHAQIIIALQ